MTIATWRRDMRISTVGVLALGSVILVAGPPPSAMASVQADLERLSDADYARGYAPLVQAVMPAVVAVRVERAGADAPVMPGDDPDMGEFFERFFGEPSPPQGSPEGPPRVGLGSGFIISPDGLVVTNAHVVGDADRVEVRLDDERIVAAQVRGVDALTDLALLQIDVDAPLPFVSFGDSATVAVGDRVLAIGNPFGLGGSVTSGIVSALGRRIGSGPYDDFLQIDASINRGNSGGPTFDLAGNVVGVNTAIYSPSGGSVGIGFAISADLAQEIIADLQDDGAVSRGWLGVGIQALDEALAQQFDLEPGAEGTLVTQVMAGGAADDAGFRVGDVVIELDGVAVPSPSELSRRVAALEPGQVVAIMVLREGRQLQLDVTLGERPEPGVRLGDAYSDDAGPG